MKLLLEKGAEIEAKDNDGNTPLHSASIREHLEVVKLLLEKGADVNAKSNAGQTPLHSASMDEYTEVMKLLLERGSDVNAKDHDGRTPLHEASRHGHPEAMKLFLEKGVDVNAKDNDGKTAKDLVTPGRNRDEMIALLEEYENPDVMKMTGFDPVMHDDVTVLDYLKNDPRNIVIKDGDSIHLVNTRDMSNHMEDAIVFACRNIGFVGASNVETDTELYNIRKAGVILSGYITTSTVRKAIGEAVRRNKRVYELSETLRTIPAIVSQKVFERRSGFVSANHCQAGADGIVRDLVKLDVEGIPVFENIGDEFTETGVSVMVNAYVIVKNSTSTASNLSSIKSKIIRDTEAILESPSAESYTSRIEESKLVIENASDVPVLANLMSMFIPEIETIEIRVNGITDFSFLLDVRGLTTFSSIAKLNTWSAIHHLKSQSDTLSSLSIPVDKEISNSGNEFSNLTSLSLRNFENSDGVFEFISGLGGLENLTLISEEYSGGLTGLSVFGKMDRLSLSLSKFEGDISPIGELSTLTDLDLHLPVFTSSMDSLSVLKKLTSLKVVTGAEFDVDIRGMKLKKMCVNDGC